MPNRDHNPHGRRLYLPLTPVGDPGAAAGCPNIFECWEEREATFLILGERCTRRCGFCDVMTAKPFEVDEDEPRRLADAVRQMGLRYVVVTGVARDDLPDG